MSEEALKEYLPILIDNCVESTYSDRRHRDDPLKIVRLGFIYKLIVEARKNEPEEYTPMWTRTYVLKHILAKYINKHYFIINESIKLILQDRINRETKRFNNAKETLDNYKYDYEVYIGKR